MNDLKFNLNSIKSYKNTFISSKNYYTNTSYSTYTSSYLKYCSQSDSTVAKMVKNLDLCYSGITSSYLNILSWWNNFILNIEGIENTIKGGPQTISDSSLKSYINIAFQSLPNLNVTGNSSFSSIDQSKLSNIFSNNLDKKDDAIEEAKKKDTKDKIKSYLKSVFSINNINDKEETKELTEDEEYAIYIEKLCSTKLSKIEATHDEMNELIKALVAVQVGQTNFTEEQQSEILKYLEKNNKDYYSYVENPLDTPKSVATNMLMSAASALGYVDVNEDESLADSFKNVGASIGTAVTGVVEGVADFLTDVGATLEYGAAAVLSIGTGVYDLYQCIDSNITGEDKVYITPEVWKSALEINSENKKTNDELGNSFYDDTTVGQALKDNASNFENIRNISSQFGYEASIVALSILSGGLAGAASGTAATATTTAKSVTSIAMGASAATASFGKHSTEAYTSGAGVGESLAYGAGNAAIDYLTHWGGAKVNGISVMAGESGLSNIMNSIARVSVDAAAAGAEYTARTGLQSAFIGDKTFAEQWEANGGWSGFGQTVLTAGAFSAFGEIMDNISKVISNKKNIIEARNNDPVLTAEELNLKMDEYNRLTSIENSKEYIDYINKKNNNIDVVPNKEFDELANNKSKLYNELSKYEESNNSATTSTNPENIVYNKYEKFIDDQKKISDFTQGNMQKEIAIRFDDSKQFLYQSIREYYDNDSLPSNLKSEFEEIIKQPVSCIDESKLKKIFNAITGEEEKKIYKILKKNGITLTQEQKDAIAVYTYAAGPVLTARLRNAKCHFSSTIYDGTDTESMEGLVNTAWNLCISTGRVSKSAKKLTLNELVNEMDNIIEKSNPLKNTLIVTRGCDGLYKDGKKLDITSLKIGDEINDAAYLSTSIDGETSFVNAAVEMRIECPPGTKGVYLESYTGVSKYNQQEFLLARNTTLKITGMPEFDELTQKFIINAKVVLKN